MLAERNHDRPNSRGYTPGDARDNTTAEISNRWPHMTMDNFCSNPRGAHEARIRHPQPERTIFPGRDAQVGARGLANDIYARATVHNASLYFGAVHQNFDGRVPVVYDCRPKVRFCKKSRNCFVWRLQSRFHRLPESWHQVQQFAHGERAWTVREGFPNMVHLYRAYNVGCAWR